MQWFDPLGITSTGPFLCAQRQLVQREVAEGVRHAWMCYPWIEMPFFSSACLMGVDMPAAKLPKDLGLQGSISVRQRSAAASSRTPATDQFRVQI